MDCVHDNLQTYGGPRKSPSRECLHACSAGRQRSRCSPSNAGATFRVEGLTVRTLLLYCSRICSRLRRSAQTVGPSSDVALLETAHLSTMYQCPGLTCSASSGT